MSTPSKEKSEYIIGAEEVDPKNILHDADNVGRDTYEESKALGDITPQENKRVRRKIDLFILPLFLFTQTMQFMDKTALNYAKVFGMEKSMGMAGTDFSLSAAIFYIGYLVAQPVWSWMLGRYHAGRIMGVAAVVWGVVVLVMVASKNFTHVMVTRFFLGVFESAVTPGLSLMTGWWYKRDEIPFRQTIWYSANGIGGMVGALMAAGISFMSDEPIPRWMVTFYILGSITTALGIFLFFFMADGPSNARWLSKEDRAIAVRRVAASGIGVKTVHFNWAHGREALKDPKNWLLSIAMFTSSIPNGVVTNFSGTITKGLGFSTFNAALLDCAGKSFQIFSLLISGYVASRWDNKRLLMMTIGNVVCVFGTALMAFLPFTTQYTWGRLMGLWFLSFQSVGFTLGLIMISSNIGSYSKRVVTSSCVFTAYCVGNAVGPLTAIESEAPLYRTAAIVMMASYMVKTIAHGLLWFYMWRDNKVRDRKHGPADPAIAADNGMKGMTENENIHFRYVL